MPVRPIKVVYDINACTLLVTMQDTDNNNEETVEESHPDNLHSIMNQMDGEFPDPTFIWQFQRPIGSTQPAWVKALNPT